MGCGRIRAAKQYRKRTPSNESQITSHQSHHSRSTVVYLMCIRGTHMTDRKPPFASVEEALEDIRAGRMIVLVDDEDRENEGDLAMAAEKVTPEAINFMAKFGRGLICLALTEKRCDALALAPITPRNT